MGHHGSKNSSSENFVKMVHPRYRIISAGCHNSYGHPHVRVLALLDEEKIEEINTCEHGDIIFEFKNNSWNLVHNL